MRSCDNKQQVQNMQNCCNNCKEFKFKHKNFFLHSDTNFACWGCSVCVDAVDVSWYGMSRTQFSSGMSVHALARCLFTVCNA